MLTSRENWLGCYFVIVNSLLINVIVHQLFSRPRPPSIFFFFIESFLSYRLGRWPGFSPRCFFGWKLKHTPIKETVSRRKVNDTGRLGYPRCRCSRHFTDKRQRKKSPIKELPLRVRFLCNVKVWNFLFLLAHDCWKAKRSRVMIWLSTVDTITWVWGIYAQGQMAMWRVCVFCWIMANLTPFLNSHNKKRDTRSVDEHQQLELPFCLFGKDERANLHMLNWTHDIIYLLTKHVCSAVEWGPAWISSSRWHAEVACSNEFIWKIRNKRQKCS
jgi:hypothetical protein